MGSASRNPSYISSAEITKRVGWVEAVKADTHRERNHDGYRCAQPILHWLGVLAVNLEF